jgi:predicted GNAT family acetyltransferase
MRLCDKLQAEGLVQSTQLAQDRRFGGVMHPLDRPVWSSLATHHASLSEGGALARRFLRDVNLFASAREETAEAAVALAGLVRPGENVFVAQVPEFVIPPGLLEVKVAQGVQMVAPRGTRFAASDDDIQILTDADASEMLALATLTEPGPFLPRTHVMGTFRGIRVDGRLAAMAGERLRFPGYTEVSGVCTHPEFRGLGFARRLSSVVAANIEARGDQAFLHAWKANSSAISLYEKLGFEVRTELCVRVLKRP